MAKYHDAPRGEFYYADNIKPLPVENAQQLGYVIGQIEWMRAAINKVTAVPAHLLKEKPQSD